MTAVVRLFAHSKFVNAAKAAHGYGTDNVLMLDQPYSARAEITADTGAAQSTDTGLAPAGARLLMVQIQNGKTVHMKFTGADGSGTADTSDATYSGEHIFPWGVGFTVSILEQT